MTQQDLFDFPQITDPDGAELMAMLRGEPHMAGIELQNRMRWNARRVRAAARACHGLVVSGPGSDGYSLVSDIPVGEAIACANQRRSQGWDMVSSGDDMEKMARRYGKPIDNPAK